VADPIPRMERSSSSTLNFSKSSRSVAMRSAVTGESIRSERARVELPSAVFRPGPGTEAEGGGRGSGWTHPPRHEPETRDRA